MATTHEEKTRKGQSYIGAYVPTELAERINGMVASYNRSKFVRRALQLEVERVERTPNYCVVCGMNHLDGECEADHVTD